jgi:hypothetical protein
VDEQNQPFRAADLAALLRTAIFDAEDAAAFLGIRTESLAQALYRRRIACVRYGAGRDQRFFARGDLEDYAYARGPGASSDVTTAKVLEVRTERGKRVVREVARRW